MANLGRAVLVIEADDDGLTRGLSRTEKAVESTAGRIKARSVALGAAIGTAVGTLAVDAIRSLGREFVELAGRGVELAPVVGSFEQLTAGIGASSDAMIAAARTATKGLLTDLDLMKAATSAINLGIPVTTESFAQLAGSAVTLGRAMGQDARKSVNDLVEGLGKGSAEVLNNLGIIVKAEDAYKAYAAEVGKSADQLTASEKQAAIVRLGLEQAAAKAATLADVQLTLGERIQIAKNQMANFTDALAFSIARSPVINAAFESIGTAITEAVGPSRTELLTRLMGIVNDTAIALVGFAQVGITAADGLVRGWEFLKTAVSGVMLVIAAAVEGIIKGWGALFEQAEKIPLVGDQFSGLSASMRDAGAFAEGMRQSFQEQTAEAWEGVKGNNAMSETLGVLGTVLADTKAKMIAAKDADVDLTTAAGTATAATNDLAAATEAAKKAAEAGTKALKAQADALRGLGIMTREDVTSEIQKLQGAISAAAREGEGPFQRAIGAAVMKLKELREKARLSGQSVAEIDTELAALRRTIGESRGPLPTLTAQIRDTVPNLAAMSRGIRLFTADEMRAATETKLLTNAFDTLGIKSASSLRRTAKEARIAYERIAASGLATERELTEAWARVELAERDAGLRTISTWETEVVPAIQSAGGQIVGSMTANFSDMLTGAVSFKDGFVAIWNDLKTTLKGILDAMLRSFLNDFLGGMLSGLQGWAQQAGKIIGQALSVGGASAAVSGGATAAGAGSGASAAGAAGLGSVAAFAAGAAAPFILGRLVNPDGVYTSPEASAQMEVDAFLEGLAYQGLSLEEGLSLGLGDGLSFDARNILGIPQAFSGAFVHGTPQGSLVNVGEFNQDEVVAPARWLKSLAEPRLGRAGDRFRIYLDGRELIRSMVRHLPDEADRFGAFAR